MEEENPASPMRKIKLKTLSGSTYDMTVDSNIEISKLKIEIEKITNIPIERQRIVYMGKLFKNEDLLSKYITKDDTTIHIMARIDSSQQQQSTSQSTQQQQPQQQQQRNQQQQQQQQPFGPQQFQNIPRRINFPPPPPFPNIQGLPANNVFMQSFTTSNGGIGGIGGIGPINSSQDPNQIVNQVTSIINNAISQANNNQQQRQQLIQNLPNLEIIEQQINQLPQIQLPRNIRINGQIPQFLERFNYTLERFLPLLTQIKYLIMASRPMQDEERKSNDQYREKVLDIAQKIEEAWGGVVRVLSEYRFTNNQQQQPQQQQPSQQQQQQSQQQQQQENQLNQTQQQNKQEIQEQNQNSTAQQPKTNEERKINELPLQQQSIQQQVIQQQPLQQQPLQQQIHNQSQQRQEIELEDNNDDYEDLPDQEINIISTHVIPADSNNQGEDFNQQQIQNILSGIMSNLNQQGINPGNIDFNVDIQSIPMNIVQGFPQQQQSQQSSQQQQQQSQQFQAQQQQSQQQHQNAQQRQQPIQQQPQQQQIQQSQQQPQMMNFNMMNMNMMNFTIKELMLQNYQSQLEDHEFSQNLILTCKRFIGELIYELTEGMNNGLDDFEKFYKKSFENQRRNNSEIFALAEQMGLEGICWGYIKSIYGEYSREQQEQQVQQQSIQQQQQQIQQEQIEQSLEVENNEENQLIDEIKQQLIKDLPDQENQIVEQLSQEYLSGDINSKNGKINFLQVSYFDQGNLELK